MRYEAVIFDCDGVLVDSEKLGCTAAAIALNQWGIKTDLVEVEQFIGKSNLEFLHYYETRDGIRIDRDALSEAIETTYSKRAAGVLQAMPGIGTLLRKLVTARIPFAVASSGDHAKIRFSLEQTGLLPYFTVICSANDVQKGKPEPDLFLFAARKLGVAPERCMVVEDSIYGVKAGKKAGMLTVGYLATFAEAVLREAGADRILKDYNSIGEVGEWMEG